MLSSCRYEWVPWGVVAVTSPVWHCLLESPTVSSVAGMSKITSVSCLWIEAQPQARFTVSAEKAVPVKWSFFVFYYHNDSANPRSIPRPLSSFFTFDSAIQEYQIAHSCFHQVLVSGFSLSVHWLLPSRYVMRFWDHAHFCVLSVTLNCQKQAVMFVKNLAYLFHYCTPHISSALHKCRFWPSM